MALYLGSTAVKLGSATKPESGGTETEVVLQSKTVSPSTSTQTVFPDDGYNGLSQVTVNAIKTQSKTVSPSTSTQYATPDDGYDGLSQVVVDAIKTQAKSISPSSSSQTVTPDDGYNGLSQVTIGAISTQTKSVTPSMSTQTVVPDSGYDGLSKVTVNAISTQTKTAIPSTSSQTITPDSGKLLSSVTVNAMSTGALSTPSISVNSGGVITATSGVSTSGYISSGTTKSNTYSMSTQAGKTVTPSTSTQTAVSSGRYTTGTVYVAGDSNLVASNIKSGVSIFGVNGSYEGGGEIGTTDSISPTYTYGVNGSLGAYITASLNTANLRAILFVANLRNSFTQFANGTQIVTTIFVNLESDAEWSSWMVTLDQSELTSDYLTSSLNERWGNQISISEDEITVYCGSNRAIPQTYGWQCVPFYKS